jgi:ethanolamine ammonia-lyase small subunit
LLADGNWSWAPPALVEQGRVAVGDEVGALLRARCVVVLVGERPGLSAPDSLGIYPTNGSSPSPGPKNTNTDKGLR